MPTPDQLSALVISIGESLDNADRALPSDDHPLQIDILRSSITAARSALTAMALVLEPTMPLDEDLPGPATDDPTTCGHPQTFPSPAHDLCRTCGATRQPDGSWAVL